MLIKQNTDILKLSYRNLEEFSAAVNNNTEEESKFKRRVILLNSFKLSDLQDAEIIVKQVKKELQNSDIINVTENFSDALTSNQKTNKKDYICILNLLELRKVLQNYYRKIKRDMCLSNRNNLKKDKNAQMYLQENLLKL